MPPRPDRARLPVPSHRRISRASAALATAALAIAPCAAPVRADAPRVAADIAAVGSLVADVMGERGAPDVLVEPGASPHDRSMRPSAARALARADVVFRTSDGLTPWLADALASLAPDAESVELIAAPGTVRLPARAGATFETGERGGHGDHGAHDDDHGGAHDEGHDGEHDEDRDAAHGAGIDPHAWLDPENARAWLDAIATTLARLDPDGADAYRANAARARDGLDALIARVDARLAPVRGRPFVVAHDDLRYFEARFDVPAVGAIVASDAAGPGPARLDALRDAVRDGAVRCVFTEPGAGDRLARTVADGSDARIAEIDPLGARLEPGPDGYARLIEGVADALVDCLG